MASGIYKLTFNSGETYVGQAKDFQQRWARHDKEMLQGKHTKLMQAAYCRSGYTLPTKEVLVYCHPDWLDLYEALYIYRLRPPLNTQIPRPPGEQEEGLLDWMHEAERAELGMLEQLGQIESLLTTNADLRADTKALLDSWEAVGDAEIARERVGEAWRRLEQNCTGLSGENKALREEVRLLQEWQRRVQGLGWWGRLWAAWGD